MQLRTRSMKVFGLLPLTDLSSQDPKYLCMRQCGSVGKEKKSDKQSAWWEKKKKTQPKLSIKYSNLGIS